MLNNLTQITLLFLITIASLLPPGADANFCIENDSSVHMSVDNCEVKDEDATQTFIAYSDDHCVDVKMACAVSPTVLSKAKLKVKLKNSSDLLDSYFLSTLQTSHYSESSALLDADHGSSKGLQQIASVRLLI